MTPTFDSHITTEPKSEMLSAVSTGNRIFRDRKMYVAQAHMCRKDDIFRQRRLIHYNIGVGMGGKIIGSIILKKEEMTSELKKRKRKKIDDLKNKDESTACTQSAPHSSVQQF